MDEVVLKNLKQQLMSRNVELQMEAVSLITQSLKADVTKEGSSMCQIKTLRDVLLDADITEFLCEAMATVHSHLLEAIFACLEHLAKSKKFYNNSHVLYVVECLIRAIHFLTKQHNSFHILNRALTLLAGLLKGFIKFNGSKALQMGALNVCQVLEMTRSVLSDTHNTWNETVISVSWVLSNLVEGRNFASQLDMTSLQLFVTVLETCIAMLSAIVKNHKVRDQNAENTKREAVLLMSCITLSVARLCSTLSCSKGLENRCDKMTEMQYFPLITKYTRKIMDVLLECIQVVSAPYILEIDMDISNMELFCQFLCSLKLIYCEPVKELDTFQLSHRLGELGYLTFLPVISSWSAHKCKDGSSLNSICTSLLGELLSSMSASILNVEDLWPGGLAAFHNHLQTGLGFLPVECSYWLQALYNQDVPHSLQHAVIIFTYFLCLCASRYHHWHAAVQFVWHEQQESYWSYWGSRSS
ncbi:uncharacterized protein LOC111863703 isoform X2 [Cryptotermes secundus]|uniref:uncharacterized protein LOC111863703 isoform X2 n=1 Tax=Cryptotermes secundus TaxID=105785 RepID=UPI000CD7B375|nr:uncharacterized protein LOC111863703 isoform X2 [Cryptotermes secundus]